MSAQALIDILFHRALLQERCLEYQRALDSFVCVISIPSNPTSEVQAASLRRICILDLILGGQLRCLPSIVQRLNPSILELFNEFKGDYTGKRKVSKYYAERNDTKHLLLPAELRSLVISHTGSPEDLGRLKSTLQKIKNTLMESKDWELAKTLIPAHLARSIRGLSEAFTNISVRECMRCLNIDSLDELLEGAQFYNKVYSVEGRECVLGSDQYVRFFKNDLRRTHVTSLEESLARLMKIIPE